MRRYSLELEENRRGSGIGGGKVLKGIWPRSPAHLPKGSRSSPVHQVGLLLLRSSSTVRTGKRAGGVATSPPRILTILLFSTSSHFTELEAPFTPLKLADGSRGVCRKPPPPPSSSSSAQTRFFVSTALAGHCFNGDLTGSVRKKKVVRGIYGSL